MRHLDCKDCICKFSCKIEFSMEDENCDLFDEENRYYYGDKWKEMSYRKFTFSSLETERDEYSEFEW